MLKTTGVELELLSDGDMYLFFEKGIRGGVSKIVNRYSKANNKYMGDLYDPKQPSSYIQYLDKNGLNGWAMHQFLPLKCFQWLTKEEMDDMLTNTNKINSCTLEVDLDVPDDVEHHEWFNDYPVAP